MSRFTIFLKLLSLCTLLLVSQACGTKAPEEVSINLLFAAGENPFEIDGLADIVFLIPQPGSNLQLVFPEACADPPLAALCGFTDLTSADFRLNLEGIDKGADVTVEINFRDNSGNVLAAGTSPAFANQPTSSGVTIEVTPSSTP